MSDTLSREPQRSRQFWLDHVEHWKNSGLSKAAYCHQHSLKAGNFYNWSRKASSIRSAKHQPAPPQGETSLNFLPVTLTSPDSPSSQHVQVIRSATEVTLPTNLSAEQIQLWLSAIHELHV